MLLPAVSYVLLSGLLLLILDFGRCSRADEAFTCLDSSLICLAIDLRANSVHVGADVVTIYGRHGIISCTLSAKACMPKFFCDTIVGCNVVGGRPAHVVFINSSGTVGPARCCR